MPLVKTEKSLFVPPFGKLRGNVHSSSMACLKCMVDFLLVPIEHLSLALTTEGLLNAICRNLHFLKGWVTLRTNFRYMGTSPI